MSVKIVPKRRVRPRPPQNPRVVALAYDGLCTFEFGVAVEIFGLDRPEMGEDWYRFAVAAIEDIAAAAGFGSTATLRHHFRKQMQLSPAAYRRRFAMDAAT